MNTLAARLQAAIQTAGVPITSVSIGVDADKTTWRVHPASLQAEAQLVIDAFDPNDPALVAAERDALIASEAGREIVKALLLFYLRDKLGRNPTGAERDAARTAFLQAYRDVS